jgi:hypothetical protein
VKVEAVANKSWPMPATTTKSGGSPRHVGVEFELQGIAVDKLARLAALTLEGDVETVSDAEYLVHVPGQGDYRVEIDYALLKELAKERRESDPDKASVLEALALDALSAVSSVVVPCEIVAPPLPMEGLAEPLQKLTDAIREAGGKGTRRSLFYAFGVHLNVEPPDLDSETVAAYMKAFVCLFDWIVWQGGVDWSRRLTPYINRFPAEYDLKLTDPEYWPDEDTLIVDYLRANATRNRALDMLPLFSDRNPAAVKIAVDDDLVKARPAFHYRLANCAIDDPDWGIVEPWGRWLQIEQLAADRDKLNECCEAFRLDRDRVLHRVDNTWRETVTQWLTD